MFDGIIDVTEDDPLSLTVTPDGTVLLGTSRGAFRFRTTETFDRDIERVDRTRAAIGYTRTFDEALPGLVS